MAENSKLTLQVPALRAKMGDWVYYSAFLRMADIAARVSLADEIHQHKALRDLIQRQVDSSGHAEAIKNYLLTQDQRFFNSLVVGVYGGDPDFYELAITSSPQMSSDNLPSYIKGALGILQFDGNEKMFAIDGQHRVVGIKKALLEKKELGEDEVIVLFVGHKTTTAGMERSRRLFTTLNRYAKPVSKADIIALDEDDIVAILTRMLVEQHPFFSRFLLVKKGKAIPATDKRFFTTLEALYDVIDTFLSQDSREWKSARRNRPGDSMLRREYKKLVSFWDSFISAVPALNDLLVSDIEDQRAANYRNRNGGNLLYRPAGLMIVIAVIKWLTDEGYDLKQIVPAIAEVPMQLTDDPWNGLLWDSTNRRMIMSGDNRVLAERLMVFGLTGDATITGKTEMEMRREWAGILQTKTSSLTLPSWFKLKKL
jgi:DNA sulfur modification protein DndB